jgi:peptidoglycan/xylan/chitin deacetylase (PgdA/CDA1 family)
MSTRRKRPFIQPMLISAVITTMIILVAFLLLQGADETAVALRDQWHLSKQSHALLKLGAAISGIVAAFLSLGFGLGGVLLLSSKRNRRRFRQWRSLFVTAVCIAMTATVVWATTDGLSLTQVGSKTFTFELKFRDASFFSQAWETLDKRPSRIRANESPEKSPQDKASPNLVFRGPADNGLKLALTFDDGPHPSRTKQILDALKREEARATFCVLGNRLNGATAKRLLRRMVAEGHSIASHSMTHPDLTQLSESELDYEIGDSVRIVKEACGQDVRYLRPPNGLHDKKLCATLKERFGLTTLHWNLDPTDWKQGRTAEEIVNYVVTNARPGGIVVMHDIKAETVKALPIILKELRAKGFDLCTIDELLGTPSTSPSSRSRDRTPPANPQSS